MAEKKVSVRDPNTTKTGKPKLHSKTNEQLQTMLGQARPKMVSRINNAITKKAGRGR